MSESTSWWTPRQPRMVQIEKDIVNRTFTCETPATGPHLQHFTATKQFYHGRGSSGLFQTITPRALRKRNTREAMTAHSYQVEGPTLRINLLQHSFLWTSSIVWN
ncbi:unnamed protein product [Callosobruchus maculatus]|uniref:Uncharacterized protein n=1 Tax=Callosobruchus maculatus TaxID=64391 RepID=A0A653C2X3_CALMS|nr:unnamed protein product [Callosobruchus maculatus]